VIPAFHVSKWNPTFWGEKKNKSYEYMSKLPSIKE